VQLNDFELEAKTTSIVAGSPNQVSSPRHDK
jgi:hypothetical protein